MATKAPRKRKPAAPNRSKAKRSPKKKPTPPKRKHPWRFCPVGQHYRSGSSVSGYTAGTGKVVSPHPRSATCATNPSGKDQLYPEEIHKIAAEHFGQFEAQPMSSIKSFKEAGNRFDHLIQGWVRYWNEVLNPKDPLDPDVIKALIASESGFNPEAWNKLKGPERARGLAQVLDKTLPLLKDNVPELHDRFLNLREDDMLDPNLSICAGIRWLFRKKEVAEAQLKRPITWREAVIEYKGLRTTSKKRKQHLIGKFDKYFSELKGKR